ncbi:MAG: glycosyltransferase family 2 protein [Planctomycetota bacterium]
MGPADSGLVSFLAAALDERESLPRLLEELRASAAGLGVSYEIVVVDDGSRDGTGEWLEAEASRSPDLRVVRHPARRGLSEALRSALERSRGAVLVTLDADLQHDPADAPRLLGALAGADLACGVRVPRNDPWRKRAASRFANWFRRIVLRDDFRDVGCSFKAWRREVAEAIPKFPRFHRYIPLLARAAGFRVVEVPVGHRPRLHGRSHFGNVSRALVALRDLPRVRRMLSRGAAPPTRPSR